ncbi:MAG TPA: bifunctional diguanylate cyclase/phosphodiesterase [Acidimicrobiales bacterium]|nr:bifunctional diguanylate cyclase/phosphodiesterase [Acidimicrobiales bacterium]
MAPAAGGREFFRERRARHSRAGTCARTTYGFLALLLVGYWLSVVVRHGHYSTAIDGWAVSAFELVASALCVCCGLVRRPVRTIACALGAALASWAIGDLFLTYESIGSRQPPVPSLADAFYLGFYPLAYLAIFLFMKAQLRRVAGPSRLDGAIGALGAASLCAAFAFGGIAKAAGTGPLGTATNLAYPVGDLVLLGLVVGGSVLLSGSRRSFWMLMSAGLVVVVVGDTVNLFQNSLGASRPGSIINAVAWPTATLLMSAAPWQRVRPADLALPRREPGLALPSAAALSALGIVFWGSLHHVNRVGLALALATLLMTGARVASSVRALRALSAERHHLSLTDDLTGLRNRRYLSGLLEDYYSQCDAFAPGERDLAFLFIDLNRFKEVNDSFGHPAGDELLRQLGPRFGACLRGTDVLVRLGGDEFAVLLVGADATFASDVARRLNAGLEEPFVFQSVKVQIGASIGIALASRSPDPAALLWSADVAMFRAKQSGSGHTVYGEDLAGPDRLQLAEELRRAMQNGQLTLHYQPQMDFRTGAIASAEALLRWAHPERGLIPPMQFIPLAEEAGLMQELTEFVLDRAVAQAASWESSGRDIAVSVNVSATDLLRDGFVEMVRRTLSRYGLAPERLVVEITETCVIGDLVKSRLVVEDLRRSGIVTSLDDFGAGATSLAHLGNLGVGELKLDRSFITAVAGPEWRRVRDLVHATVVLGHALGLRVVAEGIEDKATLDLVAELGCDLAQGYYICMPKPPSELAFRPTDREAVAELAL